MTMNITPNLREQFPSGSRVAVDFDRRTIWIDGKRVREANVLIDKWRAGKLTEREAEAAICELRYGRAR